MRKALLGAILAGAVGLAGCAATKDYVKEHETAQGALIGTAGGAVLGAVIGEATTGNASQGALIGGIGGAAVGAGAGYVVEKNNP
jgi:hypothetical protein